MTINVSWHNSARTIIAWQFGSTWNWDEYYSSLERSNRMVSPMPHPVAAIIDMRSVYSFPRGVMTHATNAVLARPANASTVVLLIENTALRVLFNSFLHMVTRMLPGGSFMLVLAEDTDSALQLIDERQALSGGS